MSKREKLEQVNEALRDASFTREQVMRIIRATQQKRCYYPELAPAVGIEAATFLTQMEWRWANNASEKFYKYIDECASCRKGDSWAAELGMTRHQVEAAIKKVATRVKSARVAQELLKTGTELCHIVVYHKPSKGAMVWYFNDRLFLKLRASLLLETGDAFPEIQETAISGNVGNGHFVKNGNSYSEQTQNNKEEEEQNLEIDADALLNDDNGWDTARDEQKRKLNKKKANTPTYKPAATLLENKTKGTTMPLDFSVSPSIMAIAIERYKDEEWVRGEERKFVNNYTNKNPTFTVVDWNMQFLNEWLVRGWNIKLENEKKYGKSGTTKSAGAKRLERLEELATTDIFGDTSFEDLGRSLLAERYGSDEGGFDS